MTPSIFVFNPFAEGHIAHGNAFAPVKHQALLAEDLSNLPQFLCQPHDIVLLPKRPSEDFLNSLRQAGFQPPEFVELSSEGIDPASSLCRRELSGLRPWAWGPDSVKLLDPLFARVVGNARIPSQYFNDDIAQFYSKAWSADFLRKVLARTPPDPWLCSGQEAGVAVSTLEETLEAVAAIRQRGHHRVVIKKSYGLAGQNAVRLWEPDLLPTQHQWIAQALEQGGQLVVEPWLERELDFSIQLEMSSRGLQLCGSTGLINDLKGQFMGNWAEADYSRGLPASVAALLQNQPGISAQLQRLYSGIFSSLESELQHVGFLGPVSIDAFVYRTPQGERRLKPVVEINPRYTMGRLTVELMKHACPGTCGLFSLINQSRLRADGFSAFSDYARSLRERLPLRLEGESAIRQGAVCLNDPEQAQAYLATFETGVGTGSCGRQRDS